MKVNTPENEISCVVGVGFGFDGSISGVCQDRFNPVFSKAQDKEICGVSGGVDSSKLEILAGSKSDEIQSHCSVSLDQEGGCCVISGVDKSNSHAVSAPADSSRSSPVEQISCVVCGSVDNLKFCSGLSQRITVQRIVNCLIGRTTLCIVVRCPIWSAWKSRSDVETNLCVRVRWMMVLVEKF